MPRSYSSRLRMRDDFPFAREIDRVVVRRDGGPIHLPPVVAPGQADVRQVFPVRRHGGFLPQQASILIP